MELIDIISTILLCGGGLLIFVVVITFFISKTKRPDDKNYFKNLEHNTTSTIKKVETKNSYSPEYRHVAQPKLPNIYQLDQIRARELKVIRRPTVRETFSRDNFRSKENFRTGNEKSRYIVINEEQKKSRSDAANY